MSVTQVSNEPANPLVALAGLGDRATGRLSKALKAYAIAGVTAQVAQNWYGRAKHAVTYTVTVSSGDDLYPALHGWLLDRLPSRYRRALVVESRRPMVATPEGVGRQRCELQLYFDGNRSQTVQIGGYRAQVAIVRDERGWGRGGGGSNEEEMVRRGLIEDRIVFTTRSEQARDAVLAMLQVLVDERNARPRSVVHMAERWGDWIRQAETPIRPLNTVVLRSGLKQDLVADLEKFLQAERAYADLGIPWHRGYLLHGPPGTGKTSLARAVAGHFGLDVYFIALSAIENDTTLHRLLSRVEPRSVLVLEDIDIVHGARIRDDQAPGVSLSGLLNALDGFVTPHGLITFLTTNDYSVIDPALIRTGRVDFSYELDFVDDRQLLEIVEVVTGVWAGGVLPPVEDRKIAPSDVIGVCKEHLGDTEATLAGLKGLLA